MKNTNYSISSKIEILHNHQPLKTLDIQSDEVEFELKITYLSDIAFTLEIGLTDNYCQRNFFIKNDNIWVENKIFKLEIPNSNGKFTESYYKIKVDALNLKHHELIWFIKNNTKIEQNSIRAFDFLRVGVNTLSRNYFIHNKTSHCTFFKSSENDSPFEIFAVFQNENSCLLKFDIDKIYTGNQFITEYNEHKKSDIDFIVMILEDNNFIDLKNDSQYLISDTCIGTNGYIEIKDIFSTSQKNNLTFVLIPFPNIENYHNLARYQKIAYNNICYYQYQDKCMSKEFVKP